jgi:hypothetical protein
MSPQLTVSSLFSVLALACLCVAASLQDLAGMERPAARAAAHALLAAQAGPAPGLHNR